MIAPAEEVPPAPRRTGTQRNFYRLSQPLFSRDNLWAYIRLYHVCDRLCGGREACLLDKRRGAWQLVCQEILWVE